ncbi:unnamed protein product [Choristocarpus tenellus]
MKEGEGTKWHEVGRTEVIANNLNPCFVTPVTMTFMFEEVQKMRFEVFDVIGDFFSSDSQNLDTNKQASQGRAECALAQIMGSAGQHWSAPLVCPHLPGQNATLTVRAEEVKRSSDLVTLKLCARDLDQGSVFIVLSRLSENGPAIPCFKTEVQKGSKAVVSWKEINIGLKSLSNGDIHRPLIFEVMAYKKSGSHVHLGSCEASVADIQVKAQTKALLPVVGSKGQLVVERCDLVNKPSFFDYLAGGVELQFTVAIDYTASNGDPNVPGTLHYLDPSRQSLNEYEHTIYSVGQVIEFYDADKLFPVFGFGGCPEPSSPASHCFTLAGNHEQPEVQGVSGVLEAYRQSLARVTLSGPTLFAPVINQVASTVASLQSSDPSNQTYTILLLLTDGVINDMANTMDALVRAADYPFSVIIVGVGKQDFSSMVVLDGDNIRITNSSGKKAARDIVQFVPMRDFRTMSSHALAKEVLYEIPTQVVEYMTANQISPCPPHPPKIPNNSFDLRSGYPRAVPFNNSGESIGWRKVQPGARHGHSGSGNNGHFSHGNAGRFPGGGRVPLGAYHTATGKSDSSYVDNGDSGQFVNRSRGREGIPIAVATPVGTTL